MIATACSFIWPWPEFQCQQNVSQLLEKEQGRAGAGDIYLCLLFSLSLSLCLLVKTIIYLRIQNLNQYGFCKELYTYLVALQQLLCRHHSHQFTVKISFTDGTLQWKGFSNWETSSGYTLIQYALNYTWIWMDWWMDWLQMVLLALFESHSQKGYNINNSCIYSYYHLNICH